MKRTFVLCFAVLFYFASPLWATTSPSLQVQEIVGSVLKVLNRSDIDHVAKRRQVSGVVQSHINISSISQRTLGIHWKKANPEQRRRFSELFVQILENTYLNRIEDYSGVDVEYLDERVKEDKAIIDTRFISDKVEIPVQYKMLLEDGNWQIYDVVIEKVSLVRNYRSTYGEIVSKEGFDGLFARMEDKLAQPVGSAGQ